MYSYLTHIPSRLQVASSLVSLNARSALDFQHGELQVRSHSQLEALQEYFPSLHPQQRGTDPGSHSCRVARLRGAATATQWHASRFVLAHFRNWGLNQTCTRQGTAHGTQSQKHWQLHGKEGFPALHLPAPMLKQVTVDDF